MAKLYERLKQTINLVRETVASPAPKTAEPLLPLRFEEKRRQKLLAHFKTVAPREFDLHINLNLGKSGALMYASDLTEEYVEFNKGDVTDPTTLGG